MEEAGAPAAGPAAATSATVGDDEVSEVGFAGVRVSLMGLLSKVGYFWRYWHVIYLTELSIH